jgi:hypothetical protein
MFRKIDAHSRNYKNSMRIIAAVPKPPYIVFHCDCLNGFADVVDHCFINELVSRWDLQASGSLYIKMPRQHTKDRERFAKNYKKL